MLPMAAMAGLVAVLGEGAEGGLVGWMDRCVGARVGRAMKEAGVSDVDLGERVGMTGASLAGRVARAGSFRVDELILVAAALGRDVQDLLPADDCLSNDGCIFCRNET
ncbi:helix-turn-helix domain-containing protein [Nocardia tengchongensis]|uniref:helix-turn-helix domain-containing protein n=1 Tax=Nocardia tengchongensis TaxID=2055889 RepID=UPI00368435D3